MRTDRVQFAGLLTLLVVGIVCLLTPSSGWARTRHSVTVTVPQSVLAGARIVVPGLVTGGGDAVALRRREGRRWQNLATAGTRRGRVVIRWHVLKRTGLIRVQVVVLKGRLALTHSRSAKVKILKGRSRGGKITVVGRPERVVSVLGGSSGTVLLNGEVSVQPGQVFALGYGSQVPDGYLGTVTAIGRQGSETAIQTRPASLEQAGATGELDLSTFHEVGPGVSPAIRRAHRALGHGASFSAGAFNPDLTKAIKCSDGASASIEGKVSMSVTPSLHASFSPFHGLKSADFSLTGAVNAALTASADASAGCHLDPTALLRNPLHIATFEGSIGFLPVVVVLQGQMFVDGDISGQASVKTSVDASASVTGGVKYADHKFGPIFSGPNASFTFNPPTVTASGSAKADVEPALQMLLDGVGGPQIGVKGGLDFAVDTSANPWWTLTAPVSIEASLTAPALDLESGSLTLFSHTFNIANAGGPLHPPPPPSAQARHITNYQSTQDLACTLNTAEDSADEFYTSADSGSGGAPNDACGTFMSLDGTLYGPATIPAGSNLGTYEAWTPVDQTTSGSGSSSDPYVTVTTVAAGGTGVQLTQTDTWVQDASTVDSTMAVSGPDGDTDSGLLYRAADCYVGNSDIGFGTLDPSTGSTSCLRDNADGTSTAEQLIPLTGGASSVEDAYDNIWSDIGSQQTLPNSCQCGQSIDNGFATEWPVQLNGANPISYSSRFEFASVPGSGSVAQAAHSRPVEKKDATRTMSR